MQEEPDDAYTDRVERWRHGHCGPHLPRLTGPINSNDLVKIRCSFELRRNSGAASVEMAIRYSDDGQTWDSPSAIGPASTTSDGWTYGTSFVDVTTGHGTRKRHGQLGAWVRNDSGSAIEFVDARAAFDHSDS